MTRDTSVSHMILIPADAHYDSDLNSRVGHRAGWEDLKKNTMQKVIKMKTVFLPQNLKRSFTGKKKSFKPIEAEIITTFYNLTS